MKKFFSNCFNWKSLAFLLIKLLGKIIECPSFIISNQEKKVDYQSFV